MRFIFSLICFLIFAQIVTGQVTNSDSIPLTSEQIYFPLLDLGFHGKLLNLSLEKASVDVNPYELTKKSSRTLDEILSLSKLETDKIEFLDSISSSQYHVIAGCFSSLKNAQNLVSDLTNDGYNSIIVGKTITGLYMVNYNSFFTKKEAYLEAEKLNRSGLDTWIKKI